MADKGNIHKDHRIRMRKKYFTQGAEALPTHELLEMLLYATYRQGDTNLLAHELLNKYKGVSFVQTTPDEFCENKGVKEQTATNLSVAADLTLRLICDNIAASPLESEFQLTSYIYLFMLAKPESSVYALYFNRKNRLVDKQCLSCGKMHRPVNYVEEILKKAFSVGCSRVVICHNHRNGAADASAEDIMLTGVCKKELEAAGIEYFGHYITTDRDCFLCPIEQ